MKLEEVPHTFAYDCMYVCIYGRSESLVTRICVSSYPPLLDPRGKTHSKNPLTSDYWHTSGNLSFNWRVAMHCGKRSNAGGASRTFIRAENRLSYHASGHYESPKGIKVAVKRRPDFMLGRPHSAITGKNMLVFYRLLYDNPSIAIFFRQRVRFRYAKTSWLRK